METQQNSNILPAPAVHPKSNAPGSNVVQPSIVQTAVSSGEPLAQQAQDNQAQLQVQTSAPLTADDNDLIEKEWVLRAKEIVSGTRQDPYQQNRSIMRLRADYLKKRYNKDVNVGKA